MKYVFLVAMLLAGCSTTAPKTAEPIIVPGPPVVVAVDAPCVPKELKPKPDYVDTKEKLLAALDAAERFQLLYGGRAQREARLNELEPIIEGCPRGK